MARDGTSILDITKALNSESVASPNSKRWQKTTVHRILSNEVYTGTLVWGVTAKDGNPPVRVEEAFPTIVSRDEFAQVRRLLELRAPTRVHPRRASSSYLLSGLAKCQLCDRALTAHQAKSGRYTYCVCQSLLKHGRGSCTTPRLTTRQFEEIDSIGVIARPAEEMGEFLQTSEVTEAKSFIRSFVKRITVRPGRAVIHYTIPTPPDSPLLGADAAEVELGEGVRSTGPFGRPKGTVLRTFVWEVAL